MGASAAELQKKMQKYGAGRNHEGAHSLDGAMGDSEAKKKKAYANQQHIDDAEKMCAYGHKGCKK